MMKYLIVTILLILIVLNGLHVNKEWHRLEIEMRQFMEMGDRFTKRDALILCEAISLQNEEQGFEPLDCDCFINSEEEIAE